MKDETGYSVQYYINGLIHVKELSGKHGGYDDSTLTELALIAKKHKVHKVVIEGNFGDGMYLKIFTPILLKHWNCEVVEVTSKGQKERRICDVLEPVLGSHRLVVEEQAIYDDYNTAKDKDGKHSVIYSGFYQLTRITRDKGALAHDDRLDALAIGVQYFVESMDVDNQKISDQQVEDFLEEHLAETYKSSQSDVYVLMDGGITLTNNHDDDDFGGSFIDKW